MVAGKLGADAAHEAVGATVNIARCLSTRQLGADAVYEAAIERHASHPENNRQ